MPLKFIKMRKSILKTLGLALAIGLSNYCSNSAYSQDKKNPDVLKTHILENKKNKRLVGLGLSSDLGFSSGSGFNPGLEFTMNNAPYRRIEFGGGVSYRRYLDEDDDAWNIFCLNLEGGIRWKKSRYNLSSEIAIPVEFRHLTYDNFGVRRYDLEAMLFLDWKPLTIEIFPFPNFPTFSIHGSAKIRYFNFIEPDFSAGVKVYV